MRQAPNMEQALDTLSPSNLEVELAAKDMGGTFKATTGFQDSDICQKAVIMVSSCILSVSSHLSGFTL